MAGIYIHIPFCKQACFYCDFHFSVNQKQKQEMVDAIVKELILQKNYFEGEQIKTIYFGGGTPSILDITQIKSILSTIENNFSVTTSPEITLEANPDDLYTEKAASLKQAGINRLSIGIQSFNEGFLKWMNRAHNAEQSLNAVAIAKAAGFDNITIDLIYGIPAPDHAIWRNDLEKAVSLGVNHISAYSLTIEPKTVFGRKLKKGELHVPSDQFALTQFEMLIEKLETNGFIHYEISNFGKENYFSRHNTSYWLNHKYLGVGPSAHSYNSKQRQYNIASNGKYIAAITEGKIPSETEVLTVANNANELLLTGLRTIWGIDVNQIYRFKGLNTDIFQKEMQQYLDSGDLILNNSRLTISKKGKFIADRIISDLFFV